MIFSIHTFELTLFLKTEMFQKLKNRAYDKAKGKYRLIPGPDKYCDFALAEKGIKIEYHVGTYKKKIKLIVNPTKLLGGDDVIKLWKPKTQNVLDLITKLDSFITGYFNSRYGLDDFTLTRIDFTVNIDVGSKENVSAYIKVLHKLGRVKGYSHKYHGEDNRIDKALSFDLSGNSNGIEFTAYDKAGECKRKEAEGILRVEIRLKKRKAIQKWTEETLASKLIIWFASNCKNIFLSVFADIVPFGDFYKKSEAVKLINASNAKKRHKAKMLKLLSLIPKKKSLYLAQKEMKDRNLDKVMVLFAQINVSPVTISKQQKVQRLKNLYSYFAN